MKLKEMFMVINKSLIKLDWYFQVIKYLKEMLNNLFFIAASDGEISLNEVDLKINISIIFI